VSGMTIIVPIAISSGTPGVDTILASTNVPENDYPAWNSGTTYAAKDRSIKGHKVWESVAGGNINHDPEADTTSSYWLEVGTTNRWRFTDQVVNIQMTNPNTIAMTFEPGEIANAFAAFNMVGTELSMMVTDAVEGVVYDVTVSLLDDSLITDSYAYCFNDIVYVRDIVLLDLPSYGNAEYSVTIDAGSGTAKVGETFLGRWREIGLTKYGSSAGITRYSVVEVDQFGKRKITPRSYAKRADFDLAVPTDQLSGVQNYLADIGDTLVVFIGSENHTALIVPGYVDEATPVFSNPAYSDLALSVKGIV